MDGLSLARTLHRLALEDRSVENVGRIIISDAQKLTQTPTLTGEKIIDLLKCYYPNSGYDYDLRTPNCLLIFFDGRDYLRDRRSRRRPANCVPNRFPADTENLFTAEKYRDPDEYTAEPDSQNVIW